MLGIKVRKRLEDYDRNKIITGITKSGVTPEQAEKIVLQVEDWISSVAVDGIVSSGEIKAKVVDLLRGINSSAAKVFENYKKED